MNSLAQIILKPKIFDVIGIGFGPSNVALAIALEEHDIPQSALFLEKSRDFAWHPGMLLPDATMQVSFLKDLANPRNPRSRFTFVNYLHQKSRLMDFVNLKTFFPSRTEFHDYFSWCAEAFRDRVLYGQMVTRIEVVGSCEIGGPLYRVTALEDGVVHQYLARTIAHSCGLEPVLPHGIETSDRVFHNHYLLSRLEKAQVAKGSHIVVAGGGQSAAEICEYLLGLDPSLSVTAVVSRFGYVPADDSPFVNQIFDPEHVDSFFNATDDGRRRILDQHAATNYAVADLDVIERLYWTWYQDKVTERRRFRLQRCSRLLSADKHESGVSLRLKDLSRDEDLAIEADYLVCATGFRPRSPLALMAPDLAGRILTDDIGMPRLGRDHRLKTDDPGVPPLFCIGTGEASHGLSATLISNMAIRAGELADTITAHAMQTVKGMTDAHG